MTYTAADVKQLVNAARDAVRHLDNNVALHPGKGHHLLLDDALNPFPRPEPTPEDLRRERGKAAYDEWNRQGDPEGPEAWARVADAAIAKAKEQEDRS